MKAKRGKCLALAAVLAMVVCAFAVALPAWDSDASDTETVKATEFKQGGTLEDKGEYYVAKGGKITGLTGTDGNIYNFYLLKGASVTFGTLSSNGTFNIYLATALTTAEKNITYNTTIKLASITNDNGTTYTISFSRDVLYTTS